MKIKFNVENADWFINPQMAGHYWAKDMVEWVKNEYLKLNCGIDKERDKFFRSFIFVDNEDWHYWQMHLTKKYVNQVRYVLRHIKDGPLTNLCWLNRNEGCLKSKLTWYLEVQAYQQDRDNYFDNYRRTFNFYGMSNEDALRRFVEYHEKLKEKVVVV